MNFLYVPIHDLLMNSWWQIVLPKVIFSLQSDGKKINLRENFFLKFSWPFYLPPHFTCKLFTFLDFFYSLRPYKCIGIELDLFPQSVYMFIIVNTETDKLNLPFHSNHRHNVHKQLRCICTLYIVLSMCCPSRATCSYLYKGGGELPQG